jgi:hypothetical protein
MALSLHMYFRVGAVLQNICIINKITNIVTNTFSYRRGFLLDMLMPARNT